MSKKLISRTPAKDDLDLSMKRASICTERYIDYELGQTEPSHYFYQHLSHSQKPFTAGHQNLSAKISSNASVGSLTDTSLESPETNFEGLEAYEFELNFLEPDIPKFDLDLNNSMHGNPITKTCSNLETIRHNSLKMFNSKSQNSLHNHFITKSNLKFKAKNYTFKSFKSNVLKNINPKQLFNNKLLNPLEYSNNNYDNPSLNQSSNLNKKLNKVPSLDDSILSQNSNGSSLKTNLSNNSNSTANLFDRMLVDNCNTIKLSLTPDWLNQIELN